MTTRATRRAFVTSCERPSDTGLSEVPGIGFRVLSVLPLRKTAEARDGVAHTSNVAVIEAKTHVVDAAHMYQVRSHQTSKLRPQQSRDTTQKSR